MPMKNGSACPITWELQLHLTPPNVLHATKRMNGAEFDVIIAGGGVIGASIAWRLARNQRRVLLLDAAPKIGSEASSAAAGMLAPGGEFDQPSPLLDFAIASLAKYDDFVGALEADSGLPVEFHRTSAVQIAISSTDLESLSARAASQRTLGIPSAALTRDELRALVPLVRPDAIGAIHYTNEAIVDPAALMTALHAACLSRGVAIRQTPASHRSWPTPLPYASRSPTRPPIKLSTRRSR